MGECEGKQTEKARAGRVNRLAVQTAMWWMCGTLQRGEEPPTSCKEEDPSPVQGPALSSEVKSKTKVMSAMVKFMAEW